MCIKIIIFLLFVILLYRILVRSLKTHNCFSGGHYMYDRLKEIGVPEDEIDGVTNMIKTEVSNSTGHPLLQATRTDKLLNTLKKGDTIDVNKIKSIIGEDNQKNEMKQLLIIPEKEEGVHLFDCPDCGKSNHTHKLQQRRALDEPSTDVMTCLECGKKWSRDN